MFLFLQYQPRYAVSDRGGEHSLTVSQGVCRWHSHPKGHVSEAEGAVAFSDCNYTLICALYTSNFLSAASGMQHRMGIVSAVKSKADFEHFYIQISFATF